MEIKIAFGCDHAAYDIKGETVEFIKSLGYGVNDFGCNSKNSCDYPDYAQDAARSVASGGSVLGVLICGTGIGMSIASNKVPGARAALCWNEEVAKLSREHNDANILCLSARFLTLDEIKKIIRVWLNTPFSNQQRHKQRIGKIMGAEKKCPAK